MQEIHGVHNKYKKKKKKKKKNRVGCENVRKPGLNYLILTPQFLRRIQL